VVELFEERLPSFVNEGVVDEPTGRRVNGTFDDNLHAETMTVQALTFMALGNMGQTVCGLETHFSNESDVHCEKQLAAFWSPSKDYLL
jgi:hypothetical protein